MPNRPAALAEEDFVALVARHQQRLHLFVGGLVHQAEQTRDLVQDTFYDAWRMAQSATPPFTQQGTEAEQVRWLWRAAYHNAIDTLRRHRLLRWEPLDVMGDVSLNDEAVWSFEDHVVEGDALGAALAQLAPEDVAVLLLRIVQGFSAAEVAQIVGSTPVNVAKRLSRAKQRLRAVYQQQNAQPEEQPRR